MTGPGTALATERAAPGVVRLRMTRPEASLALAGEIMKLSPQTLAQCKASIHLSGDVDLRSARRFGVEALSSLVGSADWLEGMGAFVAKRPPNSGAATRRE